MQKAIKGIIRKKVKSSNIAEIGYSEKHQVLEVTFNNEKTYQYSPITQGQFDELDKAESKGKWFNENVRGKEGIEVVKVEAVVLPMKAAPKKQDKRIK